MDNVEDLMFEKYGFETSKDGEDNPKFGDKGESLYAKGFSKDHQWTSFYQIMGSRDHDTQEYHLWLNRTEFPGDDEELSNVFKSGMNEGALESHLDEVTKSFKRSRGIPEQVEIQLDVVYKIDEDRPASLSVKGTNFEELYASFETTLMKLGYLDRTIQNKRSVIIKGTIC